MQIVQKYEQKKKKNNDFDDDENDGLNMRAYTSNLQL